MATFSVRCARGALVALALAIASPPAGASGQAPARIQVSFLAGPLSHSLLGEVEGVLPGIGANGLAVRADVEGESSTLVGGRVELGVRPTVRLRLRVARASTAMRLQALTEPVGGGPTQPYTFDGLGKVVVWLADADVAWTPWHGSAPIAPYLFAGVGASNWDLSGLDAIGALPPLLESPVSLSDENAFLPGMVFGVGVALGSFGPLTLDLELSDHVSGDPLDDDDFRIGTEFLGFGRAKDLVHNLTITAGARVALRR